MILYSCQSKSEKQTTTETTPQTTETTPQTTESSSSVKNIEGTYEFDDCNNTWVLTIKNKEGEDNEKGTANIHIKRLSGDENTAFGSWYHYETMGNDWTFNFLEESPRICFDRREVLDLTGTVPGVMSFSIDFNNMLVYRSSDANEAENPKGRYKLTKVK